MVGGLGGGRPRAGRRDGEAPPPPQGLHHLPQELRSASHVPGLHGAQALLHALLLLPRRTEEQVARFLGAGGVDEALLGAGGGYKPRPFRTGAPGGVHRRLHDVHQRHGELLAKTVDEEVGRVAGDGQDLRAPLHQLQQVLFDRRQRVRTEAHDPVAAVRDVGVRQQDHARVLRVARRRRALRKQAKELRGRGRPHPS